MSSAGYDKHQDLQSIHGLILESKGIGLVLIGGCEEGGISTLIESVYMM